MKKEIGIQCAEATAKAFFRTISVPEHRTLSYLGIDAKGAILEHPTALKEAFEAGEKLCLIRNIPSLNIYNYPTRDAISAVPSVLTLKSTTDLDFNNALILLDIPDKNSIKCMT
jgi:hypothetical protein